MILKKINDIQKYEEEISEKESKLTQAISEKEQILKQLHIVQEQLEHYFIENQEIKKKLPPVLYGAAEQIKQELGYRLGYIIVSYSKSLKGIITMPFALIRECVFEKNVRRVMALMCHSIYMLMLIRLKELRNIYLIN